MHRPEEHGVVQAEPASAAGPILPVGFRGHVLFGMLVGVVAFVALEAAKVHWGERRVTGQGPLPDVSEIAIYREPQLVPAVLLGAVIGFLSAIVVMVMLEVSLCRPAIGLLAGCISGLICSLLSESGFTCWYGRPVHLVGLLAPLRPNRDGAGRRDGRPGAGASLLAAPS